ncbi:MAG: peptidylprolyl isomerase [Aridibacter sp.]|jgi:cyclophilin family peptidyl-prolyl cis-trans isomerase
MSKKLTLLTILIFSLSVFSCENKQVSNNNSEVPEVGKNVKPIADNEVAVIEMENQAAFGTITIELYSNIAPKMVARFKELAKEGFYNGVSFHRINPQVIQTGDPNTKDNDPANDGAGGSDKPDVEAEFSDLKFDTGIVGAARGGQDFNSANSQFFIMLKREEGFDNKYTIFGKVINGMNNARTIGGATRDGERPLDDIKIKQIKIEPKP